MYLVSIDYCQSYSLKTSTVPRNHLATSVGSPHLLGTIVFVCLNINIELISCSVSAQQAFFAYSVYVIFLYFHFVINVIEEICIALGIQAFRIQVKQQ